MKVEIAPNNAELPAVINYEDLKDTVINYSKGEAIANPLTAKRENGDGTVNIDGWAHAQLLNTKSDIWVKGHMISQELGGKGSRGEENLTIITKSTNSQMTNGPEKYAKDKTKAGKTLSYKVNWENHPDKGDIKNFAKDITIEIEDLADNQKKNFSCKDLDPPSENVDGVVLHLNDLGRPMLKEHFGVDELFAKELLEAKGGANFSSITDLANRMEIYYINEGYSKDSPKMQKMKDMIRLINNKIKTSNNLLKI